MATTKKADYTAIKKARNWDNEKLQGQIDYLKNTFKGNKASPYLVLSHAKKSYDMTDIRVLVNGRTEKKHSQKVKTLKSGREIHFLTKDEFNNLIDGKFLSSTRFGIASQEDVKKLHAEIERLEAEKELANNLKSEKDNG